MLKYKGIDSGKTNSNEEVGKSGSVRGISSDPRACPSLSVALGSAARAPCFYVYFSLLLLLVLPVDAGSPPAGEAKVRGEANHLPSRCREIWGSPEVTQEASPEGK